jgi:NAD dependent epimerase/dehydratase family enzyme
MKHKKIVIAGGTGFIGQAMARYFGKDNHVILLSRHSANDNKLIKAVDGYNITYWRWDGIHVEKHWLQDIDGADIVINLAGKSVNCRYTEKNKQQILNSRTQSTKAIGDAIRQTVIPPKLWINASSATIYQHTTDKPNDEITGVISDARKDNMPYSFLDRLRYNYKKDKDFSVQVCQRWENSFFDQRTPFTRKIALRIGIALGPGSIMTPYYNFIKAGIGGKQGKGSQLFSWLHIEDLCRIVEWSYEHKELEGVYNCCTQQAITNAHFMKTLRTLMGKPFGLPAYTWLLEVGAALIGTESEMVLKSRWAYPAQLLQSGFSFKYNELEHALLDIVKNTHEKK